MAGILKVFAMFHDLVIHVKLISLSKLTLMVLSENITWLQSSCVQKLAWVNMCLAYIDKALPVLGWNVCAHILSKMMPIIDVWISRVRKRGCFDMIVVFWHVCCCAWSAFCMRIEVQCVHNFVIRFSFRISGIINLHVTQNWVTGLMRKHHNIQAVYNWLNTLIGRFK